MLREATRHQPLVPSESGHAPEPTRQALGPTRQANELTALAPEPSAVLVVALVRVLEARDAGLARHGRAVAGHCVATGRELGLPPTAVEHLRVAGALHDIGKVGLPDRILHKPGGLSSEEWRQVRRHPQLGADLLAGLGMAAIAGWILAHHERPDGRGYPSGLRGERIPLPARILAVGDAYDAMRSERAYKPAMSHAQAARELRRGAARQFDSAAVAALLLALERLSPAESADSVAVLRSI